MNDDATLDELLATYADAPEALTAAQRARVEAALAEDDGGTVAAVRALPTAGAAPDWRALEERIFAATTRAPARRRPWLYAGVVLAAAAAVALAVRPHAGRWSWPVVPLPSIAVAPTPAPTPVDDDDPALAMDDDPASDLDGLGPIDDALIDEVIAFDDEDDGDDELPALGATWTGWIDDFSDDELDRALAWLDAQEAG
ncbi:MAG: hypothetical protein JNK64_17605 [Myxococcales bacterium]|nr:hypothetical protein [Myxococcales bacterium]